MRRVFIQPQTIQRKQNSFYAASGNQQQTAYTDSVATSFIAWKLRTDGEQTITDDGEYGLVMETVAHKYPNSLDYVETNEVSIAPPAGLYECVFYLRCKISLDMAVSGYDRIRLRLHVDNGGDDEVVAESVTYISEVLEESNYETLAGYDLAVEWLCGVSHYVVADGDSITPTLEVIGLPASETVVYEGYFCGYLLDNRAS